MKSHIFVGKYRPMKRTAFLTIVLFLTAILNAQEKYHFRTEAPQGFSVEKSSTTALSLRFALSEISIADIDKGEVHGQEIILKGCFGSFAKGLPDLPFVNQYVAVPKDATVSIEVKEKASHTINGIEVLPAAPLQMNCENKKLPLHWDENVFGKDANYPSCNVTIAQTTQIRGLDVALLNVTPVRYNPVRKTLEVIYDMDIEVRFEGGDGQFGDNRYRNPDWDNLLRDLVINSDMLPEAHYYDLLNTAIRDGEEGCEYLIISPDDEGILAWADTLKMFRTKQGIPTKVVTVTECGGNNPEAIKGYIQNAYEHWAIPPAAVMIFSGLTDTLISVWPELFSEGTTGIPGFRLLFRGYDGEGDDYGYRSDNPFGDMNGDSIPDIAVSRIPAMTPQEYQNEVEKLIRYETDPPTDSHYYDRPILTSGYEDNKWFLITSQCVNGFFQNKLAKDPYNFYMMYEYSPGPRPDTLWSTGFNTEAVVNYFGHNGQNYLPRYPNMLDDWHNMWQNSYFKNALNSGSFLTLYRDHSSYHWWCCPEFRSFEIPSLTNTVPTFILSIGCYTGKYTNSYRYGSLMDPPIISTFGNDPVGALGGIGAATVTRSHFNDIICWGILDHFWPDFLPDLGTMMTPEYVRPSYALVAGKLFLNEHAFLPNWWPQKITDTHNVFHFLGDAYLHIYTEVPQPMTVDAPLFTDDTFQYTFTVEEGAIACLSHDGDILQAIPTTGQPQSISTAPLTMGDHFIFTVTKQNRIRFEQEVTVGQDNATSENCTLSLKLFPNPTEGLVNLLFDEQLQGEALIEVFNLPGERLIATKVLRPLKGETLSLDLSQLAAGVYHLQVTTKEGSWNEKISIK